MAIEIKMPQLSDTMSSGKILTWKKNVGDPVKRGDILAEVETDKANLEIESFSQGTLLKIVIPAESAAKVGEVIAVVGEAGEAVANGNGAPQQAAPAQQQQQAAPAPQQPKAEPQKVEPAKAAPRPAQDSASDSGRIKASPLAKSIARQHNIDLSTVQGSGPNGRIVRKDIEVLAPESGTPASSSTPAQHRQPSNTKPQTPAATSSAEGKLTPFTKMRDTIARRMQESVTTAPHFYATLSIRMDEVMKLREVLKAQEQYKGISVNHFVIKAVAYALTKEPRVNRAVRDNQVYEPGQINIGVITAIEDGLLIPVVREADKLHLKDLVFEVKAAVERARAGRPNSSDLLGGTFSISNLGMFDVESFTAIINPGQGAVLAVGSVKEELIVKNGAPVVASMMKVTLSVDHRVIDGVMSAQFLKFFKEGLETPALLLL